MPVVRLTAKERILIHLADYAKYADAVEVPPEMGQEGVARAAGIYVQHARQFLDPLLKEGFVRERTAHVKGHRRRLKVYDLTDSGRIAASRLRERVRSEPVRVRDSAGVRETTIEGLLHETKGRMGLGAIVQSAVTGAIVDLEAEGAKPSSGFVERLSDLPRLAEFVGRQAELEALTASGSGPRFFVVRGMPGIGKSSLAAKVCERLRGTRSLFWHRVRPWDTRESILADLGSFLAAQGRPGLHSVLERGEADRADQVLREDLGGTNCFLVFDDAHESAAEVVSFLRFLKDTVGAAPDVRVLVLSRTALAVHDRRDVAISSLVREIDLGGLSPTEIDAWLATDPNAPRLVAIAQRLDGHPLFLELVRSAGRSDVAKDALRDVRRFIEEEIYGRLSDEERTMMKVASLYEVPVPREALFADVPLTHDVLRSLRDRALLQAVGEDTYAAHDTIRDFFASVLTPTERRRLAGFAVEQLQRLAAAEREAGNPVGSVDRLANGLRLTDDPSVKARLAESLGDATELIGDLPRTLTAYRSAFAGIESPVDEARLHRKIAAAFQDRGATANALVEIEAGWKALASRRSVEQAWLDLVRCRVAMKLEEWTEAREHADRAFQAFRAFDESSGMGQALLERGRVEIEAPGGSPTEANRYLEEALAHGSAAGGKALIVRAHLDMASNLAYRVADPAAAFRQTEAAESLLASIHDPYLERALRMMRGWMELDFRGDYAAARQYFEESIELGHRVHSPEGVAFARFGLAHAAFFERNAAASRKEFEAIAEEFARLGYPTFAVESWWMIAQCCMWLADLPGFKAAMTRLRGADLGRAVEARPFHAAIVGGLERGLQGDGEGAVQAFREAVRASEESFRVDSTSPVFFTEFFLSVGLGTMGRDREAADSLRKSEALLRDRGLDGRLSVVPEAYRRFTDFLRQAATPPT